MFTKIQNQNKQNKITQNKTTQATRTLYNRLKALGATIVSTALVVSCTAAPVPALAMDKSVMISKTCYILGKVAYDMLNEPKEYSMQVMENVTELKEEDTGIEKLQKITVNSLYYYGLAREDIYKGEAMKKLLILKCPEVFNF